jgi:Actin
VLSLFALGVLTGLVLDCGAEGCRAVRNPGWGWFGLAYRDAVAEGVSLRITSCRRAPLKEPHLCYYPCTMQAPVVDGYLLDHAVRVMPVGGRQVTDRLLGLLQRRGFPLTKPGARAAIEAAKQQLCYVSVDRNAEQKVGVWGPGEGVRKKTCVGEGGLRRARHSQRSLSLMTTVLRAARHRQTPLHARTSGRLPYLMLAISHASRLNLTPLPHPPAAAAGPRDHGGCSHIHAARRHHAALGCRAV